MSGLGDRVREDEREIQGDEEKRETGEKERYRDIELYRDKYNLTDK